MADSQMRHLGWRFWYARRDRFMYPGLYVWAFRRNLRIFPLPKR
jgi:hypothetical protein